MVSPSSFGDELEALIKKGRATPTPTMSGSPTAGVKHPGAPKKRKLPEWVIPAAAATVGAVGLGGGLAYLASRGRTHYSPRARVSPGSAKTTYSWTVGGKSGTGTYEEYEAARAAHNAQWEAERAAARAKREAEYQRASEEADKAGRRTRDAWNDFWDRYDPGGRTGAGGWREPSAGSRAGGRSAGTGGRTGGAGGAGGRASWDDPFGTVAAAEKEKAYQYFGFKPGAPKADVARRTRR